MAHNDITGDRLISKTNSKAYEDGYELLFGKKKEKCNTSEIVFEESLESAMDDLERLIRERNLKRNGYINTWDQKQEKVQETQRDKQTPLS